MFKRSGFTLIELLIVVAIIAILAAIAVPNFLEAQTRSKASRAKSDLRTIVTALESYAVDNNTYPIPRITSDAFPAGGNNAATPHSCTQFVPGGVHIVSYTIKGGGGSVTGEFGGLTSPISYITSVMPDVFVINRFSKEHEDLGYQNNKFWSDNVLAGSNMGENNTSSLSNPIFFARYGHYTVRSLGPDRRYSPVTQPYDPTNGTISIGDIYRTAKRENNPSSITSQ